WEVEGAQRLLVHATGVVHGAHRGGPGRGCAAPTPATLPSADKRFSLSAFALCAGPPASTRPEGLCPWGPGRG
ncbi:MAG: hypothetical protein AAF851_19315, partial [Myxococcota bacterium]